MQHLWFFLLLIVVALAFALLEVQIEGAAGWAANLPAWRVDNRFTRAVTWVNAADDALRTFLTDAGWAPDTAHRELDLDGTGATTVKQVRLHTAIG